MLNTACIGMGFEMEGRKFLNMEGFVSFFLVIWFLSVCNAECIMAPLLEKLRRCSCSCASRAGTLLPLSKKDDKVPDSKR